jgi:hypothetical protein
LAPCDFSLFSHLKIKLNGRHFNKIEVIEAESQAVLNIFTEHDFQDALTRWQKRWERWVRAAPVPEIMDNTCIYVCGHDDHAIYIWNLESGFYGVNSYICLLVISTGLRKNRVMVVVIMRYNASTPLESKSILMRYSHLEILCSSISLSCGILLLLLGKFQDVCQNH